MLKVIEGLPGTPEMMSKIAKHIVEAEVKEFPYAKVEEEILWAKN